MSSPGHLKPGRQRPRSGKPSRAGGCDLRPEREAQRRPRTNFTAYPPGSEQWSDIARLLVEGRLSLREHVVGEVGEPVGAVHALARIAAFGLNRDGGAVLLEHGVQVALSGLERRVLGVAVLDAHGRVEGLLRDVLRLDGAALVVRVEDTETDHVRRRGLDELLVRGATAVPVHALAATAAAGERNE